MTTFDQIAYLAIFTVLGLIPSLYYLDNRIKFYKKIIKNQQKQMDFYQHIHNEQYEYNKHLSKIIEYVRTHESHYTVGMQIIDTKFPSKNIAEIDLNIVDEMYYNYRRDKK